MSRAAGSFFATSNMKTVLCDAVKALLSAPRDAPRPSSVLKASPSAKWTEPRNAICSMKWAMPSFASSSSVEPVAMRRRSETPPTGEALWRMR